LGNHEKFKSNKPVVDLQPKVLVLTKLTYKSKPALEKGAIFCGRLGDDIYL